MEIFFSSRPTVNHEKCYKLSQVFYLVSSWDGGRRVSGDQRSFVLWTKLECLPTSYSWGRTITLQFLRNIILPLLIHSNSYCVNLYFILNINYISIAVLQTKETQKVYQYQYHQWSGCDVPETPQDLVSMIHNIKQNLPARPVTEDNRRTRSVPLLVHCWWVWIQHTHSPSSKFWVFIATVILGCLRFLTSLSVCLETQLSQEDSLNCSSLAFWIVVMKRKHTFLGQVWAHSRCYEQLLFPGAPILWGNAKSECTCRT